MLYNKHPMQGMQGETMCVPKYILSHSQMCVLQRRKDSQEYSPRSKDFHKWKKSEICSVNTILHVAL